MSNIIYKQREAIWKDTLLKYVRKYLTKFNPSIMTIKEITFFVENNIKLPLWKNELFYEDPTQINPILTNCVFDSWSQYKEMMHVLDNIIKCDLLDIIFVLGKRIKLFTGHTYNGYGSNIIEKVNYYIKKNLDKFNQLGIEDFLTEVKFYEPDFPNINIFTTIDIINENAFVIKRL